MPKFKVTGTFTCDIEREIEAETEDEALDEFCINGDEEEIQDAIELATYTVDEVIG